MTYLLINRIAKNQHYDTEGLIDIFRQYGDHLYSKGDHIGAIEQYIKTIGKLEPSYVIRKFLDSQHIDYLTTYLQALHKQGEATEDHTTLLLNCYTKLNHTDKLKEFIMVNNLLLLLLISNSIIINKILFFFKLNNLCFSHRKKW